MTETQTDPDRDDEPDEADDGDDATLDSTHEPAFPQLDGDPDEDGDDE